MFVATFPCGLPEPVQTGSSKFELLKSRKDKERMLAIEDNDNHILYFDNITHNKDTQQINQKFITHKILFFSKTIQKKGFETHNKTTTHSKCIGIFDSSQNTMKLIPVKQFFTMKQIKSKVSVFFFLRNCAILIFFF